MRLKLYGTPLSHFARKVRILLEVLSIPYDFIAVDNVANSNKQNFADNPMMKVPVLEDGEQWLVESDHIAQYIVNKFDPADTYHVMINDVFSLNTRAILNTVMAEEVKFILGKRTGVPVEKYTFFDKSLEAIENGLKWLETHANQFNSTSPTYLEFHLVCLWDHLVYYELPFDLVEKNTTQLKSIVEHVSQNSLISQSRPNKNI